MSDNGPQPPPLVIKVASPLIEQTKELQVPYGFDRGEGFADGKVYVMRELPQEPGKLQRFVLEEAESLRDARSMNRVHYLSEDSRTSTADMQP